MKVDMAHWLEGVRRVRSPNCDERPPGCDIELLIIHGISLPPGEFGGPHVEQLFQNCLDCSRDPRLSDLAGLTVSSHLFVDRGGQITQFVPFDLRAWHAGVSSHRGRCGCNDFAIGIELEGTDTDPYETTQYQMLANITVAIMRRYPRIPLANVVGHSDVAPGRKTDPGHAFDWPLFLRLIGDRWWT